MSEASKISEEGMTAIVIPHTHWDREWYLPYQEFRIRLVRIIDKLLDFCGMNWPVKSFMLDGQISIVEDYLEVRPENRELMGRLIGEGRVKVGPWYTQPDESLCTPESIVRNLLIGRRIAKKNGWHLMNVGYLPDTFCHVSRRSDLAEDSLSDLSSTGPSFSVRLKPHEICTLLIAPLRGVAR